MFLFPLLTIIIFIWLVAYILNPSRNNHSQNYNNNGGYGLDRSLEILRERYARGEISEEEYQRIKRNLER